MLMRMCELTHPTASMETRLSPRREEAGGGVVNRGTTFRSLLFFSRHYFVYFLLKVTGQFLLNVKSSWISKTLGPPGKIMEL